MTIEQSDFNGTLNGKVALTSNADDSFRIAVMFDYITDETSSVDADITDNWVESNYTIQDHIAIKPRVYRLRGCVGEVIYQDKYSFLEAIENFNSNHPMLQKTTNVVNGITSLSGIASNYTRLAINVAKQIESSFNRYKGIWRNFNKQNQFVNKRQKAVYSWLQTVLQNRQPVKLVGMMFDYDAGIQGADYDKLYYLQSVSAHQSENAFISDIEVTIKEFRIAKTMTTKIDKKKFGGIVADQKTSEANNGSAKSTYTTTTAEELKAKSGSTLTQGNGIGVKGKIQNFFWNLQQKNRAYAQSINDFNYYSVEYKK